MILTVLNLLQFLKVKSVIWKT